MGLTEQEALSCIRISLGSVTTEQEAISAREAIRNAIDGLAERRE
jgi:cysteine sulfinate desulfinase/cysteine desulfurase-like protein